MVLLARDIISSRFITARIGCDLLDEDLVFRGDISDHMVLEGEIRHTSNNRIPGSCKLTFDEDYDWHYDRFRPYLRLFDEDGNGVFYYMGVYMLDVPKRSSGKTPARYEAEGYDIISILDTPYGSTYELAAGSNYIDTVEALLTAAGIIYYEINQTAASATTPMDLVWHLDNENTWLKIINDLLLGIGYIELYSDRSGFMRSEPFLFPQDLGSKWTYDSESDDTIMLEEIQSEIDLHEIPNKWIFVRNVPSQTLPSEGAGLYTVTNTTDGVTSTGQRGDGRPPVTVIVDVETAYTQQELEITGDRIVDRMKQPSQTLELKAGLNPSHFHHEVVTVNSSDLGIASKKFYVESWRLPIGGGPMTLTLRKVV